MSVSYSEEISYDGTNPPLQITPNWAGGNGSNTSLFHLAQTSGNRITVDYNTGANPYRVFGGLSQSDNVTDNQVYMANGAITDRIYGGYTVGTGSAAMRNSVTMSGGSALQVYGGLSATGRAVENSVSVSSGATVTTGYVIGGYSGNQEVTDNRVDISGGTIGSGSAYVIGGWAGAGSGEVAGNRVSVSGVDIKGYVFGAFSASAGTVSENQVSLSGGTITGAVYGASSSSSGEVSNNDVFIEQATVIGSVWGGSTNSGLATGNAVVMMAGNVDDLNGARSTAGNAVGNSVKVYGGNVGGITGGFVTDSGDAGKNTVLIEDGTVSNSVYGGWTLSGNASENTVTINGGTGLNMVVGGRSDNGGTASNNVVNVSGGVFVDDGNGHIYGGSGSNVNGVWSEATNNTVNLSGTPTLRNVSIYGGNSSGMADDISGNTLNVNGFAGSVAAIQNFESYNFLIGSGTDTVLDISGPLATHFDANTKVTVTGVESGALVTPGSSITLISKTNGVLASNNVNTDGVRQGTVLLYDFDWSGVNNQLVLTTKSIRAAPSAKSHSEGRAASLAFTRQGHDFIVNTGFAAANAFLGRTGAGWSEPAFFGAVGGGHFRHKTGSHVDVNGISMMTGLAWRNSGPCGMLLLGAFFEAGYADYDTRNAFASGTVRGDGDSRYFGGGIMARYDWQNGLYAEATGRVGGVKNKFHSDLTDVFGNRAKYDINSPYFGAHVGVGYKWQLNEKALLDLSAKYLWSRQSSDSAIVTGDRVRFDADNSHRARAGVRLAYSVSDRIAPYVGAAFEYEFDGKARAGAYGYNFGVPSLKGGTGVGELGLTLRHNNLSADLGVQGHIGRRDGVTGSLRVGWTF